MGRREDSVIYELPASLHHLAAPLFVGARFDEAQIDAVFEGRQPGRLFVDHPRSPTAALLCRTYDFYVAGDPEATDLRRFIRDAPAEAWVFDQFYGCVTADDRWRRVLLDDHAGRLDVVDRRGFKHHAGAGMAGSERRRPPASGVAVRPLDRDLLGRVTTELDDLIGVFWGGDDRFLADGFGFCALVAERVASVAYAIAISARYANIGVVTAAPFRRRGLATLACAAYVEHCHARGLTPTWDTDVENVASAALALKLGFVEDTGASELCFPGRAKPIATRGLWESATDRSGAIAWRRRHDRQRDTAAGWLASRPA